ncbi:hypothetical protein [Cognatilysobacter lacus]|uniref:Uncharacterized protein n=1 Tax=Cognatilysobacter lacus TaxID=1643323 RepID=A0A5D8Z9R7_9GAMM|nr:hypothetical protein [Lysobacter lacus]TZF90803.1 hypothetical protein FW784_03900 [Lysobacter lacus]
MHPHPELVYKRTDKAMTCQFREQLIAVAVRLDDGWWELQSMEQDEPTLHATWQDAVLELRPWARQYAWSQTTLH